MCGGVLYLCAAIDLSGKNNGDGGMFWRKGIPIIRGMFRSAAGVIV